MYTIHYTFWRQCVVAWENSSHAEIVTKGFLSFVYISQVVEKFYGFKGHRETIFIQTAAEGASRCLIAT